MVSVGEGCIISMCSQLERWNERESCPADILADAPQRSCSYEQTGSGSHKPWSHLQDTNNSGQRTAEGVGPVSLQLLPDKTENDCKIFLL